MAYLPLSTANLPDPAINPAQGASPEDYFGTALYTGTGSPFSVSLGFQPDLVWQKCRSATSSHEIVDSVRGYDKYLNSDTTNADATAGDRLASFDADGFSVSTSVAWNTSGRTYATWNWKANGSGVSNTDGSITSTVSANTASGTSIITWTGNATLSATIGHGLSSSPEMIIVKNRSVTNSWIVQHHSVTGYLTLNGTGAVAGSNVFTPSSTTIQFDSTWDAINGNGNSMLCYAFHSVEGFSKIGSYVGNGSTDGPFVYTGFRPSFVIIKNANFAEIWPMFDDKRDADNQVENPVYANLSSAEGTASSRGLDFLSNGFKIRGPDTSVNRSGDTHIYMAFAENPFKYSNAR